MGPFRKWQRLYLPVELMFNFTRNSENLVYTYDDVWDADMIWGCICDDGFFGEQCSSKFCPVGDDPRTGTVLTGFQYNEQQSVYCSVPAVKEAVPRPLQRIDLLVPL